MAGFAGVLEQAEALVEPCSTTTLARYLAITPGAVSQHLSALHNVGMVTRSRTGRSVLYRCTPLRRHARCRQCSRSERW